MAARPTPQSLDPRIIIAILVAFLVIIVLRSDSERRKQRDKKIHDTFENLADLVVAALDGKR